MFDGMFGMKHDGCCGRHEGGNNCWWIILIVLFFCFCGCGDKDKCWKIKFNPCTLLPILALAFCCGGFMVDREKCC